MTYAQFLEQERDRLPLIGIGGFKGGPEDSLICRASSAADRHLLKLSGRRYSAEIDVIGITVYIDGSIFQYGFDGVDNVRFERKRRCIGCRIGIPLVATKIDDPDVAKEMIVRLYATAFDLMVARLIERKVSVDDTALVTDVTGALGAFRSPSTELTPAACQPMIDDAVRFTGELRRLAAALGDEPPTVRGLLKALKARSK